MIKTLIDLCVEGANVMDLCIKGDKLIEEGLGTVFSKPIKGVKVTKGVCLRQHLPGSLSDSARRDAILLPPNFL